MLDALKGLTGGSKARKQAEDFQALIAAAKEERGVLNIPLSPPRRWRQGAASYCIQELTPRARMDSKRPCPHRQDRKGLHLRVGTRHCRAETPAI